MMDNIEVLKVRKNQISVRRFLYGESIKDCPIINHYYGVITFPIKFMPSLIFLRTYSK